MKATMFTNATILDATIDMLCKIDNRDFSVEHVVVVPDKYSLQAEKFLLRHVSPSLFNVKVVGLTRLASEMLDDMGVKCDTLSNEESLLLTQKAIENVCSDFKAFKKGGIGFCHEMNNLIGRLKSSCVSECELNVNVAGLTGAKFHDISLVYNEYQHLLNGKLDANGKLLLASSYCKENLKNKKFYFGYFDAFTAEAYQLIKTLIAFAKETNFAVAKPVSIGNEYLYEKDIFEKIQDLSVSLGIKVKVVQGKRTFSREKEGIIKGFLSYQPVKVDSKNFFHLFGVNSVMSEVEGVAKMIYYFLQKGYHYSDIVVKVSDLEKYSFAIESVFDKYDFSYFMDSPQTADRTILARVITLFFECAGMGYQKDKLVSLFENALLKQDKELIKNCLDRQVSGKAKYKKYLAKDFAFDWFFDEYDKIDGINSTKAYCALTRKIIENVSDNFDELINLLGGENLKVKNILLQTREIVEKSLDVIEQYESEISGNEFLKKLKLLLSLTDISSVPTFVDGITVGDATDGNCEECKILFVLGVQSLPKLVNEGGLLSDEEIKKNDIKEISPTIRMINRRNRFKLFSLLTTSSDKLILTYHIINDEGKRNDLPAFANSLCNIFSKKEAKLIDVVSLNRGDQGEKLKLAIGNKSNFQTEFFDRLSEDDKGDIPLPFEGGRIERDVVSHDGKELFFGDGKFRVTEIETYFSCPFKHFVRYGLRLKESVSDQITPADIGTLCHKVAELLIRQSKNTNIAQIDEKKFVYENFDSIIKSLKLDEKILLASDKVSLERYLKVHLTTFLKDVKREILHSAFKPEHQEYSFGGMRLGKEKIELTGKADRIDFFGGYFRIIDYKTGKIGALAKELYYGNKLQLFLYSKCAREKFNLACGGVFYFNAKFEYAKTDEEKKLLKGIVIPEEEVITACDDELEEKGKSQILSVEKAKQTKNGLYKGSAIAKEDMTTYEQYAIKVTQKAIDEICQGYIKPKPCPNACQWCAYLSICQFDKTKGERAQQTNFEFKDENGTN